MLSLLTVPLLVTSLVSGVGALSSASAGRIGGRAILYYVCTTVLAVSEGFAFIFIIKPGANVTVTPTGAEDSVPESWVFTKLDAFLDMLR